MLKLFQDASWMTRNLKAIIKSKWKLGPYISYLEIDWFIEMATFNFPKLAISVESFSHIAVQTTNIDPTPIYWTYVKSPFDTNGIYWLTHGILLLHLCNYQTMNAWMLSLMVRSIEYLSIPLVFLKYFKINYALLIILLKYLIQ